MKSAPATQVPRTVVARRGRDDRDHARGPRGHHAVHRVLDDQAAGGRDVQAPRRLQEQVGLGLAALDVVLAHDRAHRAAQAQLVEHEADLDALRALEKRAMTIWSTSFVVVTGRLPK